MVVGILSPERAHTLALESWGLSSSEAMESATAVAAALRTAASMMAPVTPLALRKAVMRAISPLVQVAPGAGELEELVRVTLDDVIAYGDLVEAATDDDRATRVLYLAAPTFVEAADHRLFLVGLLPGDASVVPQDLRHEVAYEGHIRFIHDRGRLAERLAEAGISRISFQQWITAPPLMQAEQFVAEFDAALLRRGRAGHVEGLSVLDHSRPVTYYRGRWTQQRRKTGRFVARRPQAYGADQWCYVELDDGNALRLLDLHADDVSRACDVAWRLQAGIDAAAGHRQVVRLRRDANETRVEVFSPIPRWLQRRWDLVGHPAASSGSLMTYRMSDAVADEEAEYATSAMWFEVQDERGIDAP